MSDFLLNVDDKFIKRVSPEQAWHYRIVPFGQSNENNLQLYIDVENFTSEISGEIELVLDSIIEFKTIASDVIDQMLSRYYLLSGNQSETAAVRQRFNFESDDFLLNIIHESSMLNSSDVHIEVYDDKARIRLRIDGLMVERYVLNKIEYPSIVNRIKIMANLDIAEKRLPQDGRIFFNEGQHKFDIRVSVLPTMFGEKIVLRLLRSGNKSVSLNSLGLEYKDKELYLEGISKPNGIVLISGPTGSGKTTTLYATLSLLNKTTRNILTIEDPIEYTIEGINQVQLKENIGFTYASALRTFLRQDPDIIMLGEIRDSETATMAVRASLTGHLVLSTIHTNSAWGTIARLKDMGIPTYLLSDTLNLSVAQRLVRLLCPHCKQKCDFDSTENLSRFSLLHEIAHHHKSVGCDKCFYTGYKGRKAIYEVIYINASVAKGIRDETDEVTSIEGMKEFRTLAVNAVSLLKNGDTSLEEIYPILLSK
jgi:type IV pilus assembly protein PilB